MQILMGHVPAGTVIEEAGPVNGGYAITLKLPTGRRHRILAADMMLAWEAMLDWVDYETKTREGEGGEPGNVSGALRASGSQHPTEAGGGE